MANSFYYDAVEMNAKMSPFSDYEDLKDTIVHEGADKNILHFYHGKNGSTLKGPASIMNENIAINYRNIYNGFPAFEANGSQNFTEYSDYLRCMEMGDAYRNWIKAKQNPTYKNIISYYSAGNIDPYGLARYKLQDFLYCKYYNQIPNNYLVTLRRYTRPCVDRMFGLDFSSSQNDIMNGNPEGYFALATAVTYMGEKPGNKLSEILKFDYGMNWEDKEAKVEALKQSDGGLAAQLQQNGVRDRQKTSQGMMDATSTMRQMSRNATSAFREAFTFSAAVQGKGKSVNDAIKDMHSYEGDEFAARYGEEFYGDVNVVNKVKMRSRGLTFTNSFSLNFEYSLKSLKCVNPRIAMMDILGNFMILTGNYGNFWGGATLFYGQHSIAPQYGDPKLLREGKFGQYIGSLFNDLRGGFEKIGQQDNGQEGNIFNKFGSILGGAVQDLLGNLLGGNIGTAGQAQAPAALLSGEPSGFWHVTVGNPLDPIAMMGNMAVTKTTVQFSDALGYDDFPTEVKFTVDLEHARPRDNAFIESMFNAGKGRIYSFTNKGLESQMHNVDTMENFIDPESAGQNQQETNISYDSSGVYKAENPDNPRVSIGTMKIMGGNLYS